LPFAFTAVLKARIDAIRCRRDPPGQRRSFAGGG